MTDKRVIQIAVANSEIYGLIDDGGLARFDSSIGKFVIRSNGEILDFDKASILKRPVVATETMVDIRKFGNVSEIKIKAKDKRKFMITPFEIALGMVVLLILLLFFAR